MAGRELSGAAGKEREATALKADEAKQIELDNRMYTAVPVNRLCNVKLHNLHKVLERLEGGKKKPYCGTRQAAINRILAAGYSEAAEAAHHVKQRAADEAAATQRAQEVAARKVEQDRKDAISREKAAKAKAEMDRRMCLFKQDLLDPEDLDFKELQYQLKRLKQGWSSLLSLTLENLVFKILNPFKPDFGKKAELRERLEGAVALQKQWIVESNEATGTVVWIGPTGMKFHEKGDAVDAGWCAPSKLATAVTKPAAVVAKPAAVVTKPPKAAHATPQMLKKPAQPETLFVEPISIDLTDDQPPTMHKAARVVPPAVSAQVRSGAKRAAPVQAKSSVAKKRGGIMSFFKKRAAHQGPSERENEQQDRNQRTSIEQVVAAPSQSSESQQQLRGVAGKQRAWVVHGCDGKPLRGK